MKYQKPTDSELGILQIMLDKDLVSRNTDRPHIFSATISESETLNNNSKNKAIPDFLAFENGDN